MGNGKTVIEVKLDDGGPTSDDGVSSVTQTLTIIVEEFPEVVSVTPAPNAPNVPTQLYLELAFSRPMDPDSVLDSELIITDLGDDDTLNTVDDHSFPIPIRAATAGPNPLVKLDK